MRTLTCLLLFFIASVSVVFAASADTPIDSVTLKDGRVLKNVQIVSYSDAVLLARWDGGRGTIAYEILPDDIQSATAPFRAEKKRLNAATETRRPAPRGDASLSDVIARLPPRDMRPIAAQEISVGSSHTVAGQCFITTKGGQNFKLGGIIVKSTTRERF